MRRVAQLFTLIPCLLIAAILVLDRPRCLPAVEPELLPDELLAEGWIQLFDGRTLFGWSPASDANWRVEDGTIVFR